MRLKKAQFKFKRRLWCWASGCVQSSTVLGNYITVYTT